MTAPQTPAPPPPPTGAPGAPTAPAAPVHAAPVAAPPPPTGPAPVAPIPVTPGIAPPPVAAQPKGNGCLKAFAIGSGVVLILGILGVVGLVIIGNRAVNELERTFGVAAPGDYALEIGECGLDDLSGPTSAGTLTNKTNRRQGFSVQIDFVDGSGTKVASGTTFTGGVEPGQKATWRTFSLDTLRDADLICRVGEVAYSPFN